jgi:hypothetical protein
MTALFRIATLICFPFFASGQTYTMSREELFAQIHDASPVKVTTTLIGTRPDRKGRYPAGQAQHYMSNGVKEIVCYDKRGNKVKIPNSPRVELRIKDTRGKNHDLYFDTIDLKDSTFTGLNSRILATMKSIRFADISKVSLQKGHKKFVYADGHISENQDNNE